LLDDVVVKPRVGGVGARGGDHVREFREVAAPLGDGLFGGRDRKGHAVVEEGLAELVDSRRGGLIDERVVDGADAGAGVDAGIGVDGEDFVESVGGRMLAK
jgi:hypothetical protein